MATPHASPEPASTDRWRKALISWPVFVPAALLLAGLVAWKGARLYLRHRDGMLMLAANHAIDTRDFRSARVWLQRLYLAHPNDIAICRLVARYDGMQRLPEELAWRARVVQIGPATLDDYLGWVAAALQVGQNEVALAALDHIPAAWRQNAAYHELYAQALAASGRAEAADGHLAAAAALEPGNPLHTVHLATLRLAGKDGVARESARAVLERFAALPSPPLSAIRALLEDAIRQHDATRMSHYRGMLSSRSDRGLEDELACISAAPSPEEFQKALASLQRSIEGNPAGALQIAEWMMQRGQAAEALAWLRKLPAAEQADIAIQTGEADALATQHDWPALRAFLTGKNWQDCDFLRIALLVRCARETKIPAPVWNDAVAACGQNGSNLLLLARMAESWSWLPDAEALYWKISDVDYPSRGPALKALWSLYSAAGNTGGLLVVAHKQFDDAPDDPGARNNFAFLSLLSGIGNAKAATLAKENFLREPENPNVAATYAYSLYLAGRSLEGLKILERFGLERMQVAGAALYLALLQQAAGQKDAALHSSAGIDSSKLLPEERLLLQKINPQPGSAAQTAASSPAL